MRTKCPKCGYERNEKSNIPAWQCPQCGVAYAKVTPEYLAARQASKQAPEKKPKKPHRSLQEKIQDLRRKFDESPKLFRTTAVIIIAIFLLIVLVIFLPFWITALIIALGIPWASISWLLTRWTKSSFDAVAGGFLVLVIGYVGIGFLVNISTSLPSSNEQSPAPPPRRKNPHPVAINPSQQIKHQLPAQDHAASKAKEKTPEEIAAEEARCREDLACWGDKYMVSAAVECAPQIERLAKYSFEWTDRWYEPKFSHYRWSDKARGIVTYIGDKIKLQNGYGAWAFYTYSCNFDVIRKTVLDVQASEGRLPR